LQRFLEFVDCFRILVLELITPAETAMRAREVGIQLHRSPISRASEIRLVRHVQRPPDVGSNYRCHRIKLFGAFHFGCRLIEPLPGSQEARIPRMRHRVIRIQLEARLNSLSAREKSHSRSALINASEA